MSDTVLDLHNQMILDEYDEKHDFFLKFREVVLRLLQECVEKNGITVITCDGRVKTRDSLIGKLIRKGYKYQSLSDITDILGTRVVTFYTDEIDKISALIEQTFDIDWNESVDKRKAQSFNTFGYMSLHTICRIPASLYQDPEYPEMNEVRFEIQIRTALQHVWATLEHDIGYKAGSVAVPTEYLRGLSRLSGLLELADEQFSQMRINVNNYRRKIQNLVTNGNFSEVPLNRDSYESYLKMDPFEKLIHRIASINQAEIYQDSLQNPFLEIMLEVLGFTTLEDIQLMKENYSNDAYRLALFQLGSTDIDIIASSIALKNLCIAAILNKETRKADLYHFYMCFGGTEESCMARAQRTIEQAKRINIIK